MLPHPKEDLGFPDAEKDKCFPLEPLERAWLYQTLISDF
jgi:hypothetical protein